MDTSARTSKVERAFGSPAFFRLFICQVVSSTGDWLGFLAIAVLATQVGANEGTAVSMVMMARILPGFFLSPVAGVLVDRWNRQHVMVYCDIGRAVVIGSLPFVGSLAGLVIASLLLEVFTLLWSPAKEASVPNLVDQKFLARANSLSLGAAYGTFPLASVLFTMLAALSTVLADVDALSGFNLHREGALAFYFDVITFLVAATIIARLDLPHRPASERRAAHDRRINWSASIDDIREGWRFVALTPTVRAVNLGLALAMVGGGLIIPLGPIFAIDVLGDVAASGDDGSGAAFGLMLSAMGFGGAAGVIGVNMMLRRISIHESFPVAVMAGGMSLGLAACFSQLMLVLPFVFLVGVCAGASYVTGFTLLHAQVEDELSGRVFAALFMLVRLAALTAIVIGPVLSAGLDSLSNRLVDGSIELGAATIAVPGVRLSFWLAGVSVVGAGLAARHSIHIGLRSESQHPSRPSGPSPDEPASVAS